MYMEWLGMQQVGGQSECGPVGRLGRDQTEPIFEDDMELNFGDGAGEVKHFPAALHAQMVSYTIDHPFRLVHNCPGGMGWRRSVS